MNLEQELELVNLVRVHGANTECFKKCCGTDFTIRRSTEHSLLFETVLSVIKHHQAIFELYLLSTTGEQQELANQKYIKQKEAPEAAQ